MHDRPARLLVPSLSHALSAVLLLAAPSRMTVADDWPQWRGPHRDGVWRETGIVERFAESRLNPVWRTPIGAGYAGPAVAAGRVYVVDKSEGSERVLCLDAEDGRILWKHAYASTYKKIGYASGPRATPTVRGGKVWTVGAMGHLHCLDAIEGNVLWSKDYVKDFGLKMPAWGVASAPLVDGNRLIALVGGDRDAMVVAFDKDTGEEIWRALSTQAVGYCPPVIFEAGGTRQLVVWLPERVVSLNPQTGDVYWQQPFESKHGLTVATPVLDAGRLFVSTFYNGPLMLRLSPDRPFAEVLWRGGSDSEIESETDRLHCMISTPVLRDDLIFGVCSYGAFRGLDASSGERLWSTYQPTGQGRWWNAFLIPHEDRTFIANEQGDLIIASLSRGGYREISRTRLIDPTNKAQGRDVVWSHPAFAYRHVFARNDREILCVSLAADDGAGGVEKASRSE